MIHDSKKCVQIGAVILIELTTPIGKYLSGKNCRYTARADTTILIQSIFQTK